MNKVKIRKIKDSEIGCLEDMLYEAIYQPDEQNLIPRTVLQIPEVNAYIKNFGKQEHDYCLVADADDKIIGAVWIRILSGKIKGYGNIDGYTPEFAISLFKEYRGCGIGTLLMTEMINYLRSRGYKQASLNVKKENKAVGLYQKMGFKIVKEDKEDYLMLLELTQEGIIK